MTIQQALTGVLDGLEFGEFALAKALADQSLNGSLDYAPEFSEGVDLAAIELLLVAYTRPDIGEGDLKIAHPDFLRKVKERLLYLAKKHNLQPVIEQLNPKPTVKGGSPW